MVIRGLVPVPSRELLPQNETVIRSPHHMVARSMLAASGTVSTCHRPHPIGDEPTSDTPNCEGVSEWSSLFVQLVASDRSSRYDTSHLAVSGSSALERNRS